MSQRTGGWKRTLKWLAVGFLLLLSLVYAGMFLSGGPNRGATAFLSVICGAGAYFIWRSLAREAALRKVEEHDRNLLAELQHETLGIAMQHGGALTVTDVAADLNLSMPDAERVLVSLVDGVRVTTSTTPDGVVVYEFPEVIHRLGRLRSSGGHPSQGS